MHKVKHHDTGSSLPVFYTRSHGQTTIGVHVTERIADIGREQWQQLHTAGHFASYEYMSALEQSQLDCQFCYALLLQDGLPVAVLIASTWSLQLPLGLRLRIMTTGSPVNVGTPLLTRHPHMKTRYLSQLLPVMQQQARRFRARLFFGRDLDHGDQEQLRDVQALYRCAYLSLVWPDFDAYLESLGKNRRKSIKRDLNAIQRAGFQLEIVNGPLHNEADIARLQSLWLQLYRKHESPDQLHLGEAYFRQMASQSHTVWFLLRHEEQLCAFDLCFLQGKVLESTYCGLDVASFGRLPVHKVMGYEIIRYAIANPALQTINFGISNEQSKLNAGCHLVMQYVQLKIFPRFLQRSLQPLIRYFLQMPEASKPGSS